MSSTNHLSDLTLRSALDNQLEARERSAADLHLSSCAECRGRLDEMQTQVGGVNAYLSALAPRGTEAPRSPQTAFAQFAARYETNSRKENVTMLQSIFGKRFRPVWIALTTIVVVLIALSFQPVRAWAGQFLGLFRVQEVTVLPVDPTTFTQLTTSSALTKQIQQVLSSSVTVTKKPAKPQVVTSAAQASQLVGFKVRLPDRTDTPRITVQDSLGFQMLIDRARAQAVIDGAGRPDLQLPASVDGAKFSVNVPAGVNLAYGECPPLEEELITAAATPTHNPRTGGSNGRLYVTCVLVAQYPSPVVDTPPNLNIQQLAELGLQFTGMSPAQAHEYAQTVDWTSTLVIPIPRNAALHKQVNVDGVTGYLIQRPLDDGPEYSLVWVKNGIVYAIGGLGDGITSAVNMANSLK